MFSGLAQGRQVGVWRWRRAEHIVKIWIRQMRPGRANAKRKPEEYSHRRNFFNQCHGVNKARQDVNSHITKTNLSFIPRSIWKLSWSYPGSLYSLRVLFALRRQFTLRPPSSVDKGLSSYPDFAYSFTHGLRVHFHERSKSIRIVWFWIGEIRHSRQDVHDEIPSRRPRFDDLDINSLAIFDEPLCKSAQLLPSALFVGQATMSHRLDESPGFKSFHLLWVPMRWMIRSSTNESTPQNKCHRVEKKFPTPTHLAQQLNYLNDAIIIWKDINTWSFLTQMILDNMRRRIAKI
jgi:hypothetical protein